MSGQDSRSYQIRWGNTLTEQIVGGKGGSEETSSIRKNSATFMMVVITEKETWRW